LESVTPSLELTVFHKGGKTPNPTQPQKYREGKKVFSLDLTYLLYYPQREEQSSLFSSISF